MNKNNLARSNPLALVILSLSFAQSILASSNAHLEIAESQPVEESVVTDDERAKQLVAIGQHVRNERRKLWLKQEALDQLNKDLLDAKKSSDDVEAELDLYSLVTITGASTAGGAAIAGTLAHVSVVRAASTIKNLNPISETEVASFFYHAGPSDTVIRGKTLAEHRKLFQDTYHQATSDLFKRGLSPRAWAIFAKEKGALERKYFNLAHGHLLAQNPHFKAPAVRRIRGKRVRAVAIAVAAAGAIAATVSAVATEGDDGLKQQVTMSREEYDRVLSAFNKASENLEEHQLILDKVEFDAATKALELGVTLEEFLAEEPDVKTGETEVNP